jgi:hypothetical protein
MKGIYASCGALVVGILLVGPVHAGKHNASQGAGQKSTHHSRHHLRHHKKAQRPWRPRLPWQEQLLPEQESPQLPEQGQLLPAQGVPQLLQGSGGSAANNGTNDPVSEVAEPNSGGDAAAVAGSAPGSGDNQVTEDIGGANAARQGGTPKGDRPHRPHKVGKGSSRNPRTESNRP